MFKLRDVICRSLNFGSVCLLGLLVFLRINKCSFDCLIPVYSTQYETGFLFISFPFSFPFSFFFFFSVREREVIELGTTTRSEHHLCMYFTCEMIEHVINRLLMHLKSLRLSGFPKPRYILHYL